MTHGTTQCCSSPNSANEILSECCTTETISKIMPKRTSIHDSTAGSTANVPVDVKFERVRYPRPIPETEMKTPESPNIASGRFRSSVVKIRQKISKPWLTGCRVFAFETS